MSAKRKPRRDTIASLRVDMLAALYVVATRLEKLDAQVASLQMAAPKGIGHAEKMGRRR